MFEAREHQNKFISDLRQALRTHQSVLGQAPTGMGKTVCAANMVSTANRKGVHVIFMVHRKELLEQTSKTFIRAEIPHTFIAAAKHYNPRMRVAVATVGTLVNRLDAVAPPRLLIVDEAHHSAAAGWARCVQWARRHGAKVIGLTATPWRLSGEGLKDHFEHMVLGPETPWLVENGYLSDYRAFIPSAPDVSGIHTRAGDYAQEEIEQVMSGRAVVGDCVTQYRAKAAGRKAVLFAVSVKHSQALAAQFNAGGIPAAHIDADTADHERRRIIMAFAAGTVSVLCNVDLFGEGFDLSAIAGRDVPIEAVIQMRPTQSLSLHLQQLGRGLRPKPYPAILLDHAGNIMRHGLPDSPYEWSLEPREKKRRGGKSEEPVAQVKQCPNCFFAHTPGPAACPNCGHPYAPGAGRKLEEVKGELHEVSKEQVAAMRKQEQQRARKLEDLIALAERRGYKNPEKWAAKIYTARLQKKPAVLPGTYGW